MPDKRVIFDVSPGATEWAWIDDRTQHVKAWERQDDDETLMEWAKIYGDTIPDGPGWRHAAKIPTHVLEKSMLEGWKEDDWKRWANNPDNSKFRTWKGRL